METRINISEILRNKLRDIKLYSPIFGDCTYCYIHDETSDICVRRPYNVMSYFNFEGLYNTAGECLLFPSKEMRDWSKFAWKKGDILVGVGQIIIFEKFIDENYTEFQGKYSLSTYEDETLVANKRCYTSDFKKLDDNVHIKNYFKEIEEKLGGKLNRETLEVEKTMPELYDGDIAFADYGNRQDVFIVSDKTDLSEGYSSFISLDLNSLTLSMGCRTIFFKKDLCKLRLATEEEKQQLFSALEKKGKAWDAKKKQVVNLKPKIELKPFDKVLVRNDKEDQWSANIFSYQVRDMYYCLGECYWRYCIPYEGNEHLLGTKKST